MLSVNCELTVGLGGFPTPFQNEDAFDAFDLSLGLEDCESMMGDEQLSFGHL